MNKFEKIIISICTGCVVLVTMVIVIAGVNLLKENRYDVNNDGKVDAIDLLKVQKYILSNGGNVNE